MKRKEFCNELVNQFNYYTIKGYENVGICLHILKLLASITNNEEFNYYCNKIYDKEFKHLIMLYEISGGRF